MSTTIQMIVAQTTKIEVSAHQSQTIINNNIAECLTMSANVSISASTPRGPDETGTYPNGYRFPKKHSWHQSVRNEIRAFWKYFRTWRGALVTITFVCLIIGGLLVQSGMMGTIPALCYPKCTNSKNDRMVWAEIGNQMINAYFLGSVLINFFPWRLKEMYYAYRWRWKGDHSGHRKLAGMYNGWYRLPSSQDLPEYIASPLEYKKVRINNDDESQPTVSDQSLIELEANDATPLPPNTIPKPPLTGIRASPSKAWTILVVIGMYLLGALIQVPISMYMLLRNRFNRPVYLLNIFIPLSYIPAIIAGCINHKEGARIRNIEGIPLQDDDEPESGEEYQRRKSKEGKGAERLRRWFGLFLRKG